MKLGRYLLSWIARGLSSGSTVDVLQITGRLAKSVSYLVFVSLSGSQTENGRSVEVSMCQSSRNYVFFQANSTDIFKEASLIYFKLLGSKNFVNLHLLLRIVFLEKWTNVVQINCKYATV